MVLMVIGFLLTPYASYGIPGGGSTGLMSAVAAFALLGFGVNLTTPLYFALVSDQSTESERPKVVAIMFIAMGVALVLTAAAIGSALEPYSRQTLHSVFMAVAGVVLLLTLLGLFRLEKPKSTQPVANRGDFKAIRELLKNIEVGRFFAYLLLTFIAIEAQEIVLEPFAAIAFGMTPGETTRLTAIYRTGFLIMLALGAVVVRRRGHKCGAAVGILQATLGFTLIIYSGFAGMATLFLLGVFLFGLGTGQISVANLTLMMSMTDSRNSGLFIGTWGFAQAVGVGGGTLLGGVLRDAGVIFFGDGIASYNIVFSFEVLLLLVSLPLVFRLNIPRFKEHSDGIATQDAMVVLGEN
jgi:BCD family chlorophyll transporter-like MFS transporter